MMATGDWKKLHNEKQCNLLSSQSIIVIMKSGGMKWTVHEGGERYIQHFGLKV